MNNLRTGPHMSASWGIGFAFASALGALGCKDKPAPSPVALTSATVLPVEKNAPPAPSAAAVPRATAAPSTSTRRSDGPKPVKAAGKAKAHELSIWDTGGPIEDLVTCGDRDIAVVLPLFPDAPMWKVVADKELGPPKTDIRKGWRGPNSDSVAFRWSGLDTSAGAYTATFSSGKDKVKVAIRIDPRMECED